MKHVGTVDSVTHAYGTRVRWDAKVKSGDKLFIEEEKERAAEQGTGRGKHSVSRAAGGRESGVSGAVPVSAAPTLEQAVLAAAKRLHDADVAWGKASGTDSSNIYYNAYMKAREGFDKACAAAWGGRT